jgi:hypothetical protein
MIEEVQDPVYNTGKMVFLAFFIIPALVAAGGWMLTNKITLKEFLIQNAVQAALIGVMTYFMLSSNTADEEIWNGRVVRKYSQHVSCEHSYSCNCRESCSGSGKNRSCSTTCDTCYDHSYDIDWNVEDSTGFSWKINRIDRRGTGKPPRWESTQMSEPTSHTHSYTNYIKGSPDSLFQRHGLVEKFKSALPAYPLGIYDYWKLDRVVAMVTSFPDTADWNRDLAQLNSRIGQAHQANALIVVVKNMPRDYFYALEQHWLGGKKNDVIPVISVDDDNKIQWVEVMALSNEDFKVKLKDAIVDTKVLSREGVMSALKTNVETSFTRRPMKDFEYLKANVQPTFAQWITGFVIGLIVAVSLSVYLYETDTLE